MIRNTLLAALVVASLAIAPGAAVAQEESAADSILTDLSNGEDDDLLSSVFAFVGGLTDRVSNTVAGIGDDTTANDAASDAVDVFNANAGTIQAYVNNRSNASTSANVLRIKWDLNGETTTRYVVADVNGSDYENASMVRTTNRTVDETCTLSGAAARNSADELEMFVDEFAAPQEPLTREYLAGQYGEYRGSATCTFLES